MPSTLVIGDTNVMEATVKIVGKRISKAIRCIRRGRPLFEEAGTIDVYDMDVVFMIIKLERGKVS